MTNRLVHFFTLADLEAGARASAPARPIPLAPAPALMEPFLPHEDPSAPPVSYESPVELYIPRPQLVELLRQSLVLLESARDRTIETPEQTSYRDGMARQRIWWLEQLQRADAMVYIALFPGMTAEEELRLLGEDADDLFPGEDPLGLNEDPDAPPSWL